VDVIRARELARFAARTGLPPEQREAVAALTRGLLNKILHAPIARLRRESTREDQLRAIEAARELFALDEAGRETPSDADDSDAPEPSDPS
jgi:glutamyl-tRNA reductase